MTPEYRQARIDCSLKYLTEIRDLAVKHRATIEYIKSLEDDAKGVGGVDYTRDIVSTSPSADRLPNSVALLIEMKRDAEASAAEYFERKRDARDRLDRMGGTRGRLLLLKYVTVLPWVRVAEVLNYDEVYCRQMRNDALCEFYDHLPLEYRMPGHSAI